MFHILGVLFIFIILLFFVGLSLIFKIIHGVVSGIKRPFQKASASKGNTSSSRTSGGSATDSFAGSSRTNHSTSSHKKLFDDDEGDYVDFEEC